MAQRAFPLRPCTTTGQGGDLPGSDRICTCVHRVFDTAGLVSPHHCGNIHVAFDHGESLGDLNTVLSVLYSPGHTRLYRGFASTLTGDRAQIKEICAWLQLHTTGLAPAISCQLLLAHPHMTLDARCRLAISKTSLADDIAHVAVMQIRNPNGGKAESLTRTQSHSTHETRMVRGHATCKIKRFCRVGVVRLDFIFQTSDSAGLE